MSDHVATKSKATKKEIKAAHRVVAHDLICKRLTRAQDNLFKVQTTLEGCPIGNEKIPSAVERAFEAVSEALIWLHR